MTTLALAPAPAPAAALGLSDAAERLLAYFRAQPVRCIVMERVGHTAAGLSEAEFAQAVEELESADLVERAAYGPLLYIL